MDAPAPSPRIAALSPPGWNGRVRLELDDGATLSLPGTVARQEGLSVGDPVDEALRGRLEEEDLRWRIREAALRLLAHRPRARGELARRLVRKDFPERIVGDCLDALEDEGTLDDAAFSRAWVRERLRRKPRARGALLGELRKKGVDREVARGAVDEVFADEEVSQRGLAVEAARAWLRRQPGTVARDLAGEPFSDAREKARRRLVGYLTRRGFRGATVVHAVEAAADEVDGGPGPGA